MPDADPIVTCGKCGAENPPESRFCGSCGNLLHSELSRQTGPVQRLGATPPDRGGDGPGESQFRPRDASPPPRPPDPETPGAGLAPGASIPPPSGQIPPPPPAPGGVAGLKDDAPSGQHQPPPQVGTAYEYPEPAAGQYGVPPPGYGYTMPLDGNTSGMGSTFPVPEVATGWSFAGFVPFGLFGFINGSPLWGALGLIGSIFGIVGLVYLIYIGVQGKQLAWQMRRFDSIEQYIDTMRIWNTWGLALLLVWVGLIVLYFIVIIALIAVGAGESL